MSQPEPTAPAHPAEARRPLTDAELERIPLAARADAGGLSRSAKAAYRQYRRFARGGDLAYPMTRTLADAMDASEDTAQRARDELLEKGYLVETDERRGRARAYRLLRGEVEVYRLRAPQDAAPATPQLAAREPQSAAHIEELRTEESAQPSAASALSRSKKEAAASPSPPGGGSAATEEEEAPKRRKTGWRFVRTSSGQSGTYVRDSEGTDRLPPGYFEPVERPRYEPPSELPELEPEEQRRERAAEMREWIFERFGDGRPRGADVGPGICQSCRNEKPRREAFGSLLLCTSCIADRHRVAIKLAAEVAAAEGPA